MRTEKEILRQYTHANLAHNDLYTWRATTEAEKAHMNGREIDKKNFFH